METKDILERWGSYIKELYDDPKRTIIPILFGGELSGPEILEQEIEHAIKQLKVGKATGLDSISCKMLRTLGQESIGVLVLSLIKYTAKEYFQKRCASQSLYHCPRSP